jgi:membrane protease subunit HflC
MMTFIRILIALVVVSVLLFITGAIYIVSETQQVVITQFGKPVGDPVTDAGLHFKIPYPIQEGRYFDKRLLEWDGDPNQIPTLDKKYIWVDTTARWKIQDALKFLQSVGTERGAQARLDDIINSATRDVITSHPLVDSIRDSNRILDLQNAQEFTAMAEEALGEIKEGRHKLEAGILTRAKELAPQYGIELVDVRIKRINYVQEVRAKVYERMISERNAPRRSIGRKGWVKAPRYRGGWKKNLNLSLPEPTGRLRVYAGRRTLKRSRYTPRRTAKTPSSTRF